MGTKLNEWQKINLLRGAKDLSLGAVCEIAEIVFRDTGEIWAAGDALDSALKQQSDSDVEITIPRWVAEGLFSGIVDLIKRELNDSKGGGRLAKVRARRRQDRLHLIRTIKVLNFLDEGLTREEAYAAVAEETETTGYPVGEDAVKNSYQIIWGNLTNDDARYYLPLSSKLRGLFEDLGDFDSHDIWPEKS